MDRQDSDEQDELIEEPSEDDQRRTPRERLRRLAQWSRTVRPSLTSPPWPIAFALLVAIAIIVVLGSIGGRAAMEIIGRYASRLFRAAQGQ